MTIKTFHRQATCALLAFPIMPAMAHARQVMPALEAPAPRAAVVAIVAENGEFVIASADRQLPAVSHDSPPVELGASVRLDRGIFDRADRRPASAER